MEYLGILWRRLIRLQHDPLVVGKFLSLMNTAGKFQSQVYNFFLKKIELGEIMKFTEK